MQKLWDEKLKNKREKEAKHKHDGFEGKRKRGLWRRESPMQTAGRNSSCVGREWVRGGMGRSFQEKERKVPAQPHKKPIV